MKCIVIILPTGNEIKGLLLLLSYLMYYLFTDWNICGTSPIFLGAVGLLYSYHTTHCSSRSLPFASASTNTTDPPSEEDSWNPPLVKKPKASLIKMCIENDKNAMLRSMRKVIIFY